MLRLYKSLVRPHVDYCSSAWSPHYVKDKIQVEKVQRRFTKMIPARDAKHSYGSRLKKLFYGLWKNVEIEVTSLKSSKCSNASQQYRLERFSN